MSAFALQRLGTLMEPQPGNPHEVEGVLNPAAARGPDGELYLFPRLVARGNFSRIGIARVRFNESGDPEGVERLGIALEPETDYECGIDGRGGCEDPRVTFVEPLQRYLMTYTARSPRGPRIAAAYSTDLFHWTRIGLVPFAPFEGLDLSNVDDKDACPFPAAVPNPSGLPELALLHRPLFPGTAPEEKACRAAPDEVDVDRESIWISYRPISLEAFQPGLVDQFSHHRLATPISPWECLKIGCGTPPILTRHGWLVVYHGVSEVGQPSDGVRHLCYSAGVMVLSKEQPQAIRYRSTEPVLTPTLPQERRGTIANVVFPTGIDRRDDLGSPDRFDVYYGMADYSIGVARLDVPEFLPPERLAGPQEDEANRAESDRSEKAGITGAR
jgi:predicted GH43/DUF377 family glycosyl hydrolase